VSPYDRKLRSTPYSSEELHHSGHATSLECDTHRKGDDTNVTKFDNPASDLTAVMHYWAERRASRAKDIRAECFISWRAAQQTPV
jgi:hypothetical protein